jgi:5-(carboxyamino)imidazole ribonucleotide synthase
MLAISARRLGYRVHTFSPERDTPAGQIADVEVVAAYDDVPRIEAFASGVDVITFEFENVPAAAAAAAEAHTIVRPSGRALSIAQHRLREKTFLRDCGLPVTPFTAVHSLADLEKAMVTMGPAVLKTASFGYDGKGQVTIDEDVNLREAWASMSGGEAVLESFIDLDREISVVAARGLDGEVALFAPIENVHHNHILDLSSSPADVSPAVAARAIDVTRSVLESLDYIGLLCVEFFVSNDGRLLINEIAPRPHNSGHLTWDACQTSQFEQQLRAICGLPLGSTDLLRPAAMVNLLGDLWASGEPDWAAALRCPDVRLHLYGKAMARPGRKMGHLTVLAPTTIEARARALTARQALVQTV